MFECGKARGKQGERAKNEDISEDKQNNIIESVQAILRNEEMLARVIDCFPYPIQVYDPNGTSVLVNKAMLTEYNGVTSDMVVGKYNIFDDPYIIALGQIPALKRALKGETVQFLDVKVPLEDIVKRYGIKDLDVVAIYQDITVFPIMDDMKQVIYVTAFMINRRIYRGKDEIERAKEYIESHWLENSIWTKRQGRLSQQSPFQNCSRNIPA